VDGDLHRLDVVVGERGAVFEDRTDRVPLVRVAV
jgi:hypothetical protein